LTVYIDTSFLVSLYSPDANSHAAGRTMRRTDRQHLISTLVELEAANALELRVHRKEITGSQANASWETLAQHVAQGVWILRPLPEQIFERARLLSRQTTARLGTGTADLLHVAAALEFGCDSLYSYDRHQRTLAREVRLKLN